MDRTVYVCKGNELVQNTFLSNLHRSAHWSLWRAQGVAI
jgi:hypothetical protein